MTRRPHHGDTMTTQAEELRTAAKTLKTAVFRGAMTATPAVAALIRARAHVAELLEKTAKHWDDGFLCCDQGPHACGEVVASALAVARAINRGDRS